jgi:glycosyltransferase involved in cell wall biosynthesis
MRIIISSLTYPLRNGVTSSINLSVDGLLKKGHEIKIVAPEYDIGKIRPEHMPIKSSVIGKLFLQLFGKEERMFSLDARPLIQKVVDNFRPDIFWLHTVNWMPNTFERIMLESNKGKVLTYHTLVEQYGRTYAGELGATQMINRSKSLGNAVDHIITPSQVIAEKLRRYKVTKPISVIPTGITPPKAKSTKVQLAAKYHFSASAPLLLWVGRISKEKNIASLLKMVSNLKKIRKDFTLLLIGPGDIEEYSKQAEQLGITQNIIFTGALEAAESKGAYFAADVFVFASKTETQGLVLGEAMIAGTPVVGLYSPIQKEIYPEKVAIVVYRENEFALCVDKLLKNDTKRSQLSERGREFVHKNFSVESMTQKQIKVFEEVIKRESSLVG